MADEQQTPQAQPAAPEPAPAQEQAAAGPADVDEGKVFAILSYALSFLGIPFFLVPLIMRNNDFSLFHAKQCLILWLGGIAASVVGVPLTAVCIGRIILPVAGIFLLVLGLMGLINAVKGLQKPLPLIGKWGVDWFKGIKKA